MTDKPHTPNVAQVRFAATFPNENFSLRGTDFDRWLASIEAAAEQRGHLDGWDEVLELLENNSEIDPDAVDHYKSLNPIRINRADQMEGDDGT